jgi:oligopeptidase B
MASGRGGASGRYEQLKEIAADYAFSLKIAGKAGTVAAKEGEKAA